MLKRRAGVYFSWLFPLFVAGGLFALDPDPLLDYNLNFVANSSMIVVEWVGVNGAAKKSGLLVGDVLVSWQNLPEKDGEAFRAPHQLREVIREYASSTTLSLTVVRQGETIDVSVPGQCWHLCVRPWFEEEDLALYEKAKVLVSDNLLEEGVALWLSLAEKQLAQRQEVSASWLYEQALTAYGKDRQWALMEQVFATTAKIADGLDPEFKAQLWERGAYLYHRAHKFEKARASLEKALALRQQIKPNSVSVLNLLTRLGKNALLPGDLNAADAYFRQAIAMGGELEAGIYYANTLNNYGELVAQTGDRKTADSFFQQAYGIGSQVAPNCSVFADTLHNLGVSAFRRGEFHRGKDYFERELELSKAGGNDSDYEALHGLAAVAWKNEEFDLAAELMHKAVGLLDQDADNPDLAWLFTSTAMLASQDGNLDEAVDLNLRALGILQEKTPDDPALAFVLYALGDLHKKKAEKGTALVYYERARSHIEAQVSKLVAPEDVRANFSAKYRAQYGRNIELLVDLKRFDEAFKVLESYHARVFSSMLTDREIAFKTKLSDEMNQRRMGLQNKAEMFQGELDGLELTDPRRKILLDLLQGLRADRARLIEDIKRSLKRQVECEDPGPLDYAGVQDVLDPGTVLLSYLIQKDRAFVFVGNPDSESHVVPLEIQLGVLQQKVSDFRRFLMKPKSLTAAKMMNKVSRDLYDSLIGPIKDRLVGSQRVLIVPDGPLHLLPFAALLDEQNRYLAQSTPFSVINSATVYGQLAQRRILKKGPAQKVDESLPRWFAFGDPLYQEKSRAGEERTDAAIWDDSAAALEAQRSRKLVPLVSSRDEVNNIGELNNHTEVILGAEATESKAMGLLDEKAELIHFACHGIYDEEYPLNSALVLSTGPEGQNGYLHAWEIMDNLSLNADLVVMSSCESALGKERGGEGLLGLTQAFQYAGARSVVASLWRVSDLATAYLMENFYDNLNKGLAKSEALRLAQDVLINQKKGLDLSHPFYWAAFQLYGNWEPVDGQGKKTVISD